MFIKLKKEIKDIVVSTPLYCIASFIIGAYTIFLIEYFCFDGHITPAGVSATIACLALLFTIYAAFKVKEWQHGKVNEKGFKKCEDMIENLGEFSRKFITIHAYASHIINIHKERFVPTAVDEEILNYNNEYLEEADQGNLIIIKLLSEQHQLRIWSYSINAEYDVQILSKLYDKYRKQISMTFELINEADELKHSFFMEQMMIGKDIYLTIIKQINLIFDNEFIDVFKPITLPSKKVVK